MLWRILRKYSRYRYHCWTDIPSVASQCTHIARMHMIESIVLCTDELNEKLIELAEL